MKSGNVPTNFADITLDAVSQYEYAKGIQSYCDKLPEHLINGQSLYLYGPYGTGKSSLAGYVLKEAASQYILCHWVNYGDLADLKYSGATIDGETSYWEYIRNIPVLVIDELDVDPERRKIDACVETLVRDRVNNFRPTVVTSNIAPKQLYKVYPALVNGMDEKFRYIEVAEYNFRRGQAIE